MFFHSPPLSHTHIHAHAFSDPKTELFLPVYFISHFSHKHTHMHTCAFCPLLSCCNLMHLSVWVPPSQTRSCFPERAWEDFSHENQNSTSMCSRPECFCACSLSLTLFVHLSPFCRFMKLLLFTLPVEWKHMHVHVRACVHVGRVTHMHFFSPEGMFLELISVIECMFYCLLLDREWAEAEECNSWYR